MEHPTKYSFVQIQEDVLDTVNALQLRFDQFGELARRMQIEIPLMIESVKKQVIDKTEDVLIALQDQSPIPDLLNFHTLFVCFFWIAIMMTGFLCGEILGSQIFPDIIYLVCDKSSAIVLNYALLPILVLRHLGSVPEYSRMSRFILLVSSVTQGTLTGYLLGERLVMLLTPLHMANILYVAIISRVIGHKISNDRQAYYSIVCGLAFTIYVISALIMGTMGKVFALNAISAVLSTHAVVQVYMHRVTQSELKPSHIQLGMLTLLVYTHSIIGATLM